MSLYFQCRCPVYNEDLGLILVTKPDGGDVGKCKEPEITAMREHVTEKWNEYMSFDDDVADKIYDVHGGRNVAGFESWFDQGDWDVVCRVERIYVDVI